MLQLADTHTHTQISVHLTQTSRGISELSPFPDVDPGLIAESQQITVYDEH